ncbi:hypothetical protein GCM10020295_18350 [Streptomyces cinereospinus]
MTSSGRMHDSSIGTPSRTFRYSGRERPACRMNHTGVCGTGSRLHALRKAESYVAVGCWPVGLPLALTGKVSHGGGGGTAGRPGYGRSGRIRTDPGGSGGGPGGPVPPDGVSQPAPGAHSA